MIAARADQFQAHFMRAATLAPRVLHARSDRGLPALPRAPARHTSARCSGSVTYSRRSATTTERSPRTTSAFVSAPESGETYWSLANLKTYRFDDATVAEMEKRVDRGRAETSSPQVNFLFALGKAYEDRGDYERAWHYYATGQREAARRGFLRPRADGGDERPADRGVSAEFLAIARGVRRPGAGADLHPRAAALGLDAARADPRQPQQVEGTSELPYVGRARELAQSQP